jgi:hypothetical protein
MSNALFEEDLAEPIPHEIAKRQIIVALKKVIRPALHKVSDNIKKIRQIDIEDGFDPKPATVSRSCSEKIEQALAGRFPNKLGYRVLSPRNDRHPDLRFFTKYPTTGPRPEGGDYDEEIEIKVTTDTSWLGGKFSVESMSGLHLLMKRNLSCTEWFAIIVDIDKLKVQRAEDDRLRYMKEMASRDLSVNDLHNTPDEAVKYMWVPPTSAKMHGSSLAAAEVARNPNDIICRLVGDINSAGKVTLEIL